jgi:hypothetical protein
MLVISVITTLCTASIAFYARFLFALCKELSPRWNNHREPFRLRLEKKGTRKRLPSRPRHSRAALQITEIPLDTTFRELRRDHT